MFLARMLSTQPKQTEWSHGLNETHAGTSSRQIMHSSSPSCTGPAIADSPVAARPWPHTLAVTKVCAMLLVLRGLLSSLPRGRTSSLLARKCVAVVVSAGVLFALSRCTPHAEPLPQARCVRWLI